MCYYYQLCYFVQIVVHALIMIGRLEGILVYIF